jgi:hypothetical protein
VSAELGRLFSTSPLPAQQLQEEFLEAFFAVAFDPKLLQQPASDLGVVSAGSAVVFKCWGLLYVWSLLSPSTPSCCSSLHQTWEW